MTAPHINTKRLYLRPRNMTDLEDCLAMDRDPNVTRHIDGPWHDAHATAEAHRRFITKRMTKNVSYPLGYWSIFAHEAPTDFLGWVMLLSQEQEDNLGELGWRLNRKAWGQGYATEAAKAVIGKARKAHPHMRFFAAIKPENVASINIATKLGLQLKSKATNNELLYTDD